MQLQWLTTAVEQPVTDSQDKKQVEGLGFLCFCGIVSPEGSVVLQTDSYLEQLTDPVAESEMSTQTDPFRDRPATPLFIPKKAGLDATTQIEAGDLFDFGFEVC